jgi:hypothetical protein
MPTVTNVLASPFNAQWGVLDAKKCKEDVKFKGTDAHVNGASLMQISAMILSPLPYVTYNH